MSQPVSLYACLKVRIQFYRRPVAQREVTLLWEDGRTILDEILFGTFGFKTYLRECFWTYL